MIVNVAENFHPEKFSTAIFMKKAENPVAAEKQSEVTFRHSR